MKQRKRKHSQFFNKSVLLLSNYEQVNDTIVMHFLCPKWHTVVGNDVFLGQ